MNRSFWIMTSLLLHASSLASAQQIDTNESPFPEARITFVYGDDNVLVGAGETKNSSPAAYFGQCSSTALDRTEPSNCGRNATNLLIYKRIQAHRYFQPEAALSLDLSLDNSELEDAGSYIRANYFMDDRHETYWAFTLYPIDGDRMRLGYHPDVSWGGTDAFPKNFRRGMAPGLQFDLDYRYWYLFAGVKTALVRSPAMDILDNPGGNTIKNVERAFYGLLGGAGFEVLDTGLRFECNGGFFNKGTNTRQNALGQPIYAGGLSGRVSYRQGIPIGRQIDTRIYQQDVARDQLFQRETYRSGAISYSVEAEASYLIQDLEDPDRVQSTKNESSWMGHVGFKLKADNFRLHLDVIYRDLTAITFDVPGFVPYQALNENVDVSPELYSSIAVDYRFEPYDITIGLAGGVLLPATYAGVIPTGVNASAIDQGHRKVVVRGSRSGDWDILPVGEDESAVYMARFDLKWHYFDSFGVIGQIYYTWDKNTSQVFQTAEGHNVRSFDEPNALGFTFITQVKF